MSEQAVKVRTLAEAEREHILAVLRVTGGHRGRAAALLEIGVRTLGLKLAAWRAAGLLPAERVFELKRAPGPEFSTRAGVEEAAADAAGPVAGAPGSDGAGVGDRAGGVGAGDAPTR